MAQVGTVSVVATIDTSQYKRGAKEVEAANKGIEGSVDKSDSSLGKLNKRLSGMARTGLKVATTGFIALAGTITAMTIKGGISRALNIEDAQAKLKGLGHDAESVETIMNSALDSVRGTAYGLDAAATIAASAVAAGVKPGKELTKYLGTTADAATIAGVSLSEMGSIFNKVQTQQKVYTQELNQLADRGIPIYQWLQDELGVTQEKLREMVAAGEVDAEVYFKAIQKNIGGAALESGKTTRGAWQNMLAAMSRVGERIVKGPIDTIRDGFGNMTKWIDNNSDRIVDTVQKVMKAIIDLGRGVVDTARFIYNMRGPILVALGAFASYRAAVIATNTVLTVQKALIAATGTQYLVMNGTIVALRTTTIAATVAQKALNLAMSLNPAGLLLGAVTLLAGGIAALTMQNNSNKRSEDALKVARQNAKVAADGLKDSEDALAGAKLSAEGATLSLERAQRTYNDTLAQYGPNSLEAREAAHQLRLAEEALARANKEVAQATKEKEAAEKKATEAREAVTKAEELKKNAIEKTAWAITGQRKEWEYLQAISKSPVQLQIEYAQTGTTSAAPAIPGVPGSRKYKGGPVSAGRAYLVGENRDGSINDTTELFVPNQAGRIISSKDLQFALGGTGGGGTEYNIGTINIASEVDGERWLRRLSGNQEIVSNGLVPTQSYM